MSNKLAIFLQSKRGHWHQTSTTAIAAVTTVLSRHTTITTTTTTTSVAAAAGNIHEKSRYNSSQNNTNCVLDHTPPPTRRMKMGISISESKSNHFIMALAPHILMCSLIAQKRLWIQHSDYCNFTQFNSNSSGIIACQFRWSGPPFNRLKKHNS